MKYKLSILVCSLASRAGMLAELTKEIESQIEGKPVEFLPLIDEGQQTIGGKRNSLLSICQGEYCVFIDDDDEIPNYYVDKILEALKLEPDSVGFRGFMTWSGTHRENFEIRQANGYYSKPDPVTKRKFYFRYTNHLCPIRTEIARKIGYPDKDLGEDYDYATRLKASGLIKKDVFITEDMYHYKYKPNKNDSYAAKKR